MPKYFSVSAPEDINLFKIPFKVKPKYQSEDEYKSLLESNREKLQEFQTLLYAEHKRSVLVIFQGMDTSGKDGAIKHVMSGINPQGCKVVSFKAPSPEELSHDYLWRINRELPARGIIGIFNRSYYEEVLIPRVHPKILATENVPQALHAKGEFWKHRFAEITNYEKYLHRQGLEIIKIFLHISKEEQKKRLLDRFNDPKKVWKISEGDVEERKFWKQYQKAYESCLSHTGSKKSPWYVVPADDKESARLSVSQILVDRFEKMQLQYPKLSTDQMKKLKKLQAVLHRT